MTRCRTLAAAAAALALGACDRIERDGMGAERADSLYQAAVADYTAGRIDAAAAGFEKAVKASPGNASARFQLAVLLQDGRHDYLGALCHYRDYMMLAPESDKASLARDRMENCEKLLAAEFAKKYNLGDSAALQSEIDTLKASLDEAVKGRTDCEAKLADAENRAKTLERELEKMRAVLKRMGDDEDGTVAPRAVAVKDETPDDGAAAVPGHVAEAAALLAEEDSVAELALNPEAKALLEEEEREEAERAGAGPVALPARTGAEPTGPKLTEFGRSFGGGEAAKDSGPQYYIVQEGETLGQIALKFYGRKKAWPKIQQANKATISSDGKVKAGQKILIP